MMRYVCVNGHDRCFGGASAGPECPYCERRRDFRCCGRKPLHYKRGLTTTLKRPQLYCTRCDAAYDPTTKAQLENWAYRRDDSGNFVRRTRT
jgi:hypothetical protein